MFRSDVVFCWFASVYAFVAVAAARLLGVKAVVAIGGVDVAADRELNYGIWLSRWKGMLVGYALRHADRVLAVDPSLGEEAVLRARYDGANIRYVPTGFDSEYWKPVGEKEPFVLCVAAVHDDPRLRVKGIDVLIEAARRSPGLTFIVIGVDDDLALRSAPPTNMTFHRQMSRADILPFYRRARVYCQPSRREGMPNALCEAMLCGCIPVATDIGGIPGILGDCGALVPGGDAGALAGALASAMHSDEFSGRRARARIVSLYPLERRQSELVRLIREFSP